MSSLVYILVTILILNHVNSDDTASDTCGPYETGLWGRLIEDWVTAPEQNERQGRILMLPQKGYYVSDRIDGPLVPPPPRGYEEWPVAPPPPPSPGKIVNRPPSPYKDKFKPSYPPPQPPKPYPRPPQRPNSVDRVDETHNAHKQVSETDLYLLGAIEKLVYRADLMEKRLRKMEETMHYLVAGTEHKPEPCVINFTRVNGVCYHFSTDAYDWKNANLACRKLRANLLELDSDTERRQLLAHMYTDKTLQGNDWWTGGLNPGLLWIWSNSARPVADNTTTTGTANNTTQTVTIVGEGRCLAIIYDPTVRAHVYRGQDCALRHRFVCEKGEDKAKLSNEIERVARKLREGGRRPKIMWSDEE